MIDAFREVQALPNRNATACSVRRMPTPTAFWPKRVGSAAQILEEAEGYRARVVNEAIGEASRFIAVAQEFNRAPEVTQRRLYLETIERTLGDGDKIGDEAGSSTE